MQIARSWRLFTRRRRSAAPRDGQEEARGDGEARSRPLDGAKLKASSQDRRSRFELMAFFAGYGFNRSHSAAYGGSRTRRVLKAHFRTSSWRADVVDADNIDNIVKFIAEARAMGLVVERPDVNESLQDFSISAPTGGGEARYPVRDGRGQGVGANAVEAILEARGIDGKFESIFDLCRRVDTRSAMPGARAARQERCARQLREPPSRQAAGGARRSLERVPRSSAIAERARRRCSASSRRTREGSDAPKLGRPIPRSRVESQAAPRFEKERSASTSRAIRSIGYPRDLQRYRARRRVTSSPGGAASGTHSSAHRQPVPRR